MIEEKDKEILRLRVVNNEAHANMNMRGSYGGLDCEQRSQLIADLGFNVDLLRQELTRIKQSIFAQIGRHINFDMNPKSSQQPH